MGRHSSCVRRNGQTKSNKAKHRYTCALGKQTSLDKAQKHCLLVRCPHLRWGKARGEE